MISVAAAEALIRESIRQGPSESVPTLRAQGRVLREPVRAERPFPPFDRVMMDGIGIARADWSRGVRRYRLTGAAMAGDPPRQLGEPESAIEVMTGAVAPSGVDLVIPVEALQRDGAVVRVADDFVPPPGGYTHPRGSDAAAGAELLAAGRRLDPRALAVAVSCGAEMLRVSTQPRVAVVSTGDELVELGQPIEPQQIRRSNVHAVAAVLRERQYAEVSLHHFPDQREQLAAGLEAVVSDHDFVLLSGGISKGRRDFVPAVLEEIGAETVFRQVAQRPGKPLLFAKRQETAIFGLPGNPVSTLVGLYRYVLPALDLWSGGDARPPCRLTLSEAFSFAAPLTLFLPVRHVGVGRVAPCPVANSGDFAGLLASDGFVELPAEGEAFPAGVPVDFRSW